MGVNVRERSIDEIKTKLTSMQTALNKIVYLESALREANLGFDVKRFLWGELAKLYSERKMDERAAKAFANRAGMEVLSKEKVDAFVSSAEHYAKLGKVDDAEEMFSRAIREATNEQKSKIKLARKNIFLVNVNELEAKGKRASTVKFYEKLIKMGDISDEEKVLFKEKLIKEYKALGMFREAKMIDGVNKI